MPGESWQRLEPDGRKTFEIHIGGGVHRKDPLRYPVLR